jgi:signal transduction histidine kinase/CRP-like cAMP-binding protein
MTGATEAEPLGAGLREPRDRNGAFPRLDDHQRVRFRAVGELRRVQPGDVLFREGDAGYDFFVIESGAVAIVQGYGHENRVIAVHGGHRFLGEVNLLTGSPPYLTAVVRDAGEVIRVPADRLREVLAHDDELSIVILRAFMARREILIDIGAAVMVTAAALRRLATLVVEGASADDLFAAVAHEVSQSIEVSAVTVWRYEPDRTVTVVAAVSGAIFPVGSRWPIDGSSVVGTVLDTGLPARIDDYSQLSGTIAEATRGSGFGSVVGVPITVRGEVWGLITTATDRPEPLPRDTSDRLRDFSELVATAIYNMEARDELQALADEQAALRRVATLVAEGTSSEQLGAAVCAEAGRLLGAPAVHLARYDPDDSITVLGTWGGMGLLEKAGLVVGSRWPLEGESVARRVLDTGRPATIRDYSGLPGPIAEMMRAAPNTAWVGVPIVVEGHTWGVIYAGTSGGPSAELPTDIEPQLARFTDLVAIAVANAQARDDLHGLADEQGALRRIATLVADGADSQIVFDAICAEAQQLVGATNVNLAQFTSDGFYLARAGTSLRDTHIPIGTRLPLGDRSISGIVARTGAPARLDSYEGVTGELAAYVRDRGIRSTVAGPILVEGRLWGAVIAGRDTPEPFPAGAEDRAARFAELAATAISNAATRAELIASRARIVAAGDEARRRIERNLHDGVQQRLIALGLDLQVARAKLPAERSEATESVERVEREIESVLEDLRELSRGLHPQLLSRRGLGPALRALARRSPIGVELAVDLDARPPTHVESAVYYVVSEALANAIKHSGASRVVVEVTEPADGPWLSATVADDGVGGAAATEGSGLAGLADRVVALGGRLSLESPPERGTAICVELPKRGIAEPGVATP